MTNLDQIESRLNGILGHLELVNTMYVAETIFDIRMEIEESDEKAKFGRFVEMVFGNVSNVCLQIEFSKTIIKEIIQRIKNQKEDEE